jgi:hypothetical protein
MLMVKIVAEKRKDGTYYEINTGGFPRFFMKWSALGRYDLVDGASLPYDLVLAVSDLIEKSVK